MLGCTYFAYTDTMSAASLCVNRASFLAQVTTGMHETGLPRRALKRKKRNSSGFVVVIGSTMMLADWIGRAPRRRNGMVSSRWTGKIVALPRVLVGKDDRMMHGTKTRQTSSPRGRRHLALAWLVLVATIFSFFAATTQIAAAQEQEQDDDVDTQQGQRVEDETPEDETLEAQTQGSARLEVHIVQCPEEFQGTSGTDYFDTCHENGLDGVNVRATTLSVEEVVSQQSGQGQGGAMPTDYDQMLLSQRADGAGPGIVVFDQLPADDYTIVVDTPGATNNFYSYCSFADSDQEVTVSPNDENNGVVSLEDGQNVICDWYIIPDPEGNLQAQNEAGGAAESTATSEVEVEEGTRVEEEDEPSATATIPPTDVATEEGGALGGAADGEASITIDMRICPTSFVDPRAANYETFAASCVDGADGVTLRLTDIASNNFSEQITDAQSNNTFPNLPNGSYAASSDIPGEFASEYLFCVADGGTRYQKQFNENGVTTFNGLTGEEITCSWYVVSEDARGEETGASLTVHLAACPVDYTGTNYFDDCHANGVGDSEFQLIGPAGTLTGTTTAPPTEGDGPGVVGFTGLAAGSYTLQGGPPGDFGHVVVYCSDQAGGENTQVPASVNSTQASFTIEDGQDLLCDWYFIGEDASGQPTETPQARAEILVTLFNCEPRTDGYAGWGFGDLDDTCTERIDDVPFRLGDAGAPPLSASTGVSGEGAVRFFDLLPGDYTLTPSLPDGLTDVAVYCSLNGSNSVYQKSLEDGATTFVDVDGDDVACSWFVTSAAVEEPSGPNGSITVREFVCEGDKTSITDWEKECVPDATGSDYTLTSSSGSVNTQGTPDANGVVVFTGLADDFYNLAQNEGTWCRATAEHVDSSSRVIVNDGGNTDVYLFHCGGVTSLPSTGTGPRGSETNDGGLSGSMIAMIIALLLIAPAGGMMLRTRYRHRNQVVADTSTAQSQPTLTESDLIRMRFR